jgi:hypothetical protein
MSGSQQLLLGSGQGAAPAVDPYFYSVTSLLHGDGTNGGQNNTFLDSSTNNFTITRNGNTTQGSFSPFSQTGWGNYFDGTSGQFLNTVANTAFNFGTGDFTVEGWVYPTSTSGTRPIVEIRTSAANSTGFALLSQSGATTLNVYTNGGFAGASTGSIATNQWNHVALVRSGNTWTYYINGTSSGSFTNSSTQSDGGTTGPKIAGSTTAGEIWIGYISNIRIVKGTAVYTSNFTPSTTPLTAISGTSLLTCQSSRFADSSTNAFAITVNGSPSVQAFSPFNPTAAWSASTNGGSGYFDGSGDYLTTTTSSAFDLSSGDWTIQGWYYPTAYSAGNNVLIYVGTSAGDKIVIADISSGGSGLYYLLNGSPVITSSTKAPLNAWSFFALVKSGSTTTLYLNGVSLGTTTSVPTSSNKSVNLGSDAGAAVFQGYFADIRILKGTANTAVPTAPLTAITNTSLLTNFTNGAIFDNAAVADYETVGNAQISTSVKKYGTGSMAFDGTGDRLVAAPIQTRAPGTGDFCYEFWFYANTSSNACLFDTRAVNNNTTGFACLLNGSSQIALYTNSTILTCGLALSASIWYHIAVTRTAGIIKIFVNGTVVGTLANTSNFSDRTLQLGQYIDSTGSLNGYIDDFRSSNGIGRYAYNFTPPTAEFPNIGGTVTLTADPYFDYTTLLLPGNGTNGAQNNTFLDSSTNAFSITRNGNTTQGTFSPFSQTGWGNYFDGTGDYLTAANNTAFQFGTGDFTVEGWFYLTSSNSSQCMIDFRASNNSPTGFFIGVVTSGYLQVYSSTNIVYVNASIGLNQWYHFAVARSGTTLKAFINGTEVASVSNSTNWSDQSCSIGRSANTTELITGYQSNIRVVKGTALYTANFTPSTTPLTAITNTSLLTCQSNRFVDNSTNAFAITRNGDVSVQAFSPFNPTAAWSAATYGGSGYYDGAGDYLRLAYTSALQFTGNFTIEFWAYPLTQASAFAGVFNNYSSWPSSTGVSIFCGHSSAGTTKWVVALFGTFPAIQSSADYIKNAWSHIALVRNGTGSNNITLYINGVSAGTFTSNNTVTGTADYWWVGTTGDAVSTQNFTGYLADFRATGSAVYTGTFTPPTAPLTAISNTQLLLAGTNAGIYDATSKNDLETVGNAQISTTQSKFGGSSMYFDGTGDYLSIPATQNIVFGTADFTIEMWVYSGSQGSTGARMFGNGAGAAWGSGKYILTTTTAANPNKFTLGINNASPADVLVSTTTFNDSTWKHVAITRYNGVFRLFVNGILESTNTTNVSVDNGTAAQIRIGSSGISGDADWAGYIDDLRITKGIARYTSNFTPPTAAFLTL